MTYASVLIVDKAIGSAGVLVNVALVIGLTAGRMLPDDTFGADVIDGDGARHRYLTNIGHHVRKADQSKLRTIREKLAESTGVTLIDYTEDAAPTDYDAYAKSLGSNSGTAIFYRAIYAYGPSEVILPLTKNLSRL